MGDTEIIGAVLGVAVICVVLYFGIGLFATFYNFDDFESDNGDLDIDTDAMEDLSEEIDDTGEVIFENFDTDGLATAGGSILVIIGIIAGCAVIAYILLR